MRTITTTSTVHEPPATSNRRQPVRQARTNPLRASVSAQISASVHEQPDVEDDEPPGFFPAITHFTDSITQLPKEMIRHYAMLREVDAKICGSEERFLQLLLAALRHPAPALKGHGEPASDQQSTDPRIMQSARRNLFLEMRRELPGLLMTLDEKNHVMNTALDCLQTQLKRCHSSFEYMEDEISEEARLGSLTHWAYNTEEPEEKKGIMAGERTRRSAAAAETELAAARSEARRDALAARKARHHNVDSDLEDPRLGRKLPGAKGRRAAEAALAGPTSAIPPSKRKRLENSGAGGVPMRRSGSSVNGSNQRGTPPFPEPKRRNRGGGAAGTGSRKRTNATAVSGRSPSMTSSPLIGTFAPSSKEHTGKAGGSIAMQRGQSSRARHATLSTGTRHRSPPINHLAYEHNGSQRSHRPVEGSSLPTEVYDISSMNSAHAMDHRLAVATDGQNVPYDRNGMTADELRGGMMMDTAEEGQQAEPRQKIGEVADHQIQTQAGRPAPISIGGNRSRNASKGPGGGTNSTSRSGSKAGTPLASTFTASAHDPPSRSANASRHGSVDGGASVASSKRTQARNGYGFLDGASSSNATAETDAGSLQPADERARSNGDPNGPTAAHEDSAQGQAMHGTISTSHATAMEGATEPGENEGQLGNDGGAGENGMKAQPMRRTATRESRQRDRNGNGNGNTPRSKASSNSNNSRSSSGPAVAGHDIGVDASDAAHPAHAHAPAMTNSGRPSSQRSHAHHSPHDNSGGSGKTRTPTIPQQREHHAKEKSSSSSTAPRGQHARGGHDEDEEGEGDGEDEPRYCYCNGVSYGEMVGCDADDCAREWFHLQCVGLTKAPAKNAKWYCDECKENLRRR